MEYEPVNNPTTYLVGGKGAETASKGKKCLYAYIDVCMYWKSILLCGQGQRGGEREMREIERERERA